MDLGTTRERRPGILEEKTKGHRGNLATTVT
jgi:hypothetical protein